MCIQKWSTGTCIKLFCISYWALLLLYWQIIAVLYDINMIVVVLHVYPELVIVDWWAFIASFSCYLCDYQIVLTLSNEHLPRARLYPILIYDILCFNVFTHPCSENADSFLLVAPQLAKKFNCHYAKSIRGFLSSWEWSMHAVASPQLINRFLANQTKLLSKTSGSEFLCRKTFSAKL